MSDWEDVTTPVGSACTQRMAVEGGYLYRTILVIREGRGDREPAVAMCFVPGLPGKPESLVAFAARVAEDAALLDQAEDEYSSEADELIRTKARLARLVQVARNLAFDFESGDQRLAWGPSRMEPGCKALTRLLREMGEISWTEK